MDLGLRVTKVDTGLSLVEVFDVEFAGFGGYPIKAWLTRLAGREPGAGPLPAVVEYNGYGGGRGLPHERLGWAAPGYVGLFMDTRGQGSPWGSGGQTPDPVGSGPATPGFMTRGILDPADHYYRRVFNDAVRAVDAVCAIEGVDPARVAVAGASQGGGIALAVAGLVPGLMGVLPDVPFGRVFRRAVDLSDREPYRDHHLPLRPPRSRRGCVPDPVLPGRRELRAPRDRPRVLLSCPDGPDLPSVDGVRGVLPLRLSRQRGRHVDRGLRVKRARGWRGPPVLASAALSPCVSCPGLPRSRTSFPPRA